MWDATETLSALIKYEGSRSEVDGVTTRTINGLEANSVALGVNIGDAIENYEQIHGVEVPFEEGDWVRSANPDRDETDSDAITLTVNWDIGEFELTSISAYSEYDYVQGRDVDFLPLNVLSQDYDQEYEAWSQEIRLASPVGGSFDYLVGMFYQNTELTDVQLLNFDLDLLLGGTGAAFPPFSQFTDYENDSETWALFGQGTWYATKKLSLILGLRFSDEDKSAKRSVVASHFNTADPIDPASDPVLFATSQAILSIFDVVVPHQVADERNSTNFNSSHEGDTGDPNWTANLRLNHSWDVSSELLLNTALRYEYVDDQLLGSLDDLPQDA